MSRLEWVTEIDCEYGGPAIVANAFDYEKWTGTAGGSPEDARVLHYWGQFAEELPPPYAAPGGHVHRRAETYEALKEDLDALLAAVKQTFPDASVSVDDEECQAHVLLPDDRQMWIEFRAMTHYDGACGAGDDDEDDDDEGDQDEAGDDDNDEGGDAWSFTYATSRGFEGTAIFWEKQGSGNFYVAVTSDLDEMVLLRTWVDEDHLEDVAKAQVDSPTKGDRLVKAALEVGSAGRVIVGYSPHSWMGIVGAERLSEVIEEVKGLDDEAAGREKVYETFRSLYAGSEALAVNMKADDNQVIASAVQLQPGSYSVTTGEYDPEDQEDSSEDENGWSCIWCRFKKK